MPWICSCKTSNQDNLNKCSNCGRKKPKYLGIKIDFSSFIEMDEKKLSVWYLKLANKYLYQANDNLNYLIELIDKHGQTDKVNSKIKFQYETFKNIILSKCDYCLIFVEKALKLYDHPAYEDNEGILINPDSTK